MPPRPRWNALACSLLLTACAGAPPATPRADDGPAGTVSARRVAPAAGALEGRVTAPANVLGGAKLVGPDGASLIGLDGASLVGQDGATLIGQDGASLRGARGLLAVAERGLAGAEVVAVDAKGRPLPGVKPATTDADGRFVLAGVPAGAYRVLAGVRTAKGVARLEAIARPDVAGGATISAATTLVARLVGSTPRMAAMDMERWSAAVAACGQALDDGMVPDWADPAGVDRAAKAAMARSAAMRPAMAALARDMGVDLDAPAHAPAAPAPSPAASPSPAPSPSAAGSTSLVVAPDPHAPTPSPVTEVHDPRLEFRATEAEASAWSYHWLEGQAARPMTRMPAQATWIGGTEARPDDLVGFCTIFADATYFNLDPSTTKMEGAAAAWTAPVAGTARVVGTVEVNAHTTNGSTFLVRGGDVEIGKVVLSPARVAAPVDIGPFAVPAGGTVWLWAQPNAMPETTDVVKCQLRLEFTRPGP